MAASSSPAAGILDGIRVLDFTAMMSGPYATRLMADLGAEVLKIEPPEGDHIRSRPPTRQGRSTYFAQLNAGKKSLALDLKKPAAIALVKQLVAGADALVENYRPGVMQRLGLDYDTLAAINPKLVYCSISGFGQTGSWSGRSAYAPVLHAGSGYDVANLSYQDGIELSAEEQAVLLAGPCLAPAPLPCSDPIDYILFGPLEQTISPEWPLAADLDWVKIYDVVGYQIYGRAGAISDS